MKKILALVMVLTMSGCNAKHRDINKAVTGCTYMQKYSDDVYEIAYEVHSNLNWQKAAQENPISDHWEEFGKYMQKADVEDPWQNENTRCDKPGYRLYSKVYEYYKISEENIGKVQELYKKYPYRFEYTEKQTGDIYEGEVIWPLQVLEDDN